MKFELSAAICACALFACGDDGGLGSGGSGGTAAVGGSGGSGGPGGASVEGIEIIRDAQGVLHVFAPDLDGAMFGLGYGAAGDRLGQMELKRMTMRGRLASVMGAGPDGYYVDLDVRHRTIGYARHAEAVAESLPADVRPLLEAYAAGVNARLAKGVEMPAFLAQEGVTTLEPWTVADCLLAWDFVSAFFTGEFPSVSSELVPFEPPVGCAPVFDDEAAHVPVGPGGGTAGIVPEGGDFTKASHSWAVAGSRNAESGAAIVVASPKLPVMYPSYLYETHISTPDLDVRGAGFAGTPGFLVFWNRFMATGGSSMGGDAMDLFQLEVVGDSYVVDGSSTPILHVDEPPVEVKGGVPVELDVRETEFGPVVTDLLADAGGREYALRHTELYRTTTHTVVGAVRAMMSKDLEGYRSALGEWALPCINTIYGDVDGNIAYQPACGVPHRAQGENPAPGMSPFDGTDSSQDWGALLSPDEMPHEINPERGYVISANQAPAGSWFTTYLGPTFKGATARSQRLSTIFGELLPEASSTVTPAQVQAILEDAGSDTARIFGLALEHLDAAGALTPTAGPGQTKEEKAWLVLQALRLWSEDDYSAWPGAQVSTTHSTYRVVDRITGSAAAFRQLVYPAPCCAWGSGESGLAHWQRAFEADPASLLGAFTTPEQAQARDFHIDFAAQTYDALGLATLPLDPASWPVMPVTITVPYQYNFVCGSSASCNPASCIFDGLDTCSLDPDHHFTMTLPFPSTHTIRSQVGHAYAHWVDLGDTESALSILPASNGEDPGLLPSQAVLDAWAASSLLPAPMSYDGVAVIMVSKEALTP